MFPEANEIYGATKLQDIKIFKIEEKAMEPIKQEQEKIAEQQRIQEAILERQHILNQKEKKSLAIGMTSIDKIKRWTNS